MVGALFGTKFWRGIGVVKMGCSDAYVNPSDWLKDVLVRIGSHKVNQLKALLPAQWGEERERGM
jgi:hypothetical protein